MDRKETVSKHYKNYLAEAIKIKTGGKTVCEKAEDVFDNIYLLAEEKVSFGDEKVRWLPLNTKKMIAKMMDPECRVDYDVKRNGSLVSCEARFYWSDNNEHPAGIGFVCRDLKSRITSDADQTAAETEIEALVRGAAASRALTDAGIGIEFYSDSFDNLFSSVEEAEAEQAAQRKATAKAEEVKKLIPEVPPKKPKAKLKDDKPIIPETPAPQPQTVPEVKPEATTAPAASEAKPAAAPAEEATKSAPVQQDVKAAAPATAGTISVEDAKLVVTTMGNFAGQPLGLLLQARPRVLCYYAAHDVPEVQEAAKVLLEDLNDPDLNAYLAKSLGQ